MQKKKTEKISSVQEAEWGEKGVRHDGAQCRGWSNNDGEVGRNQITNVHVSPGKILRYFARAKNLNHWGFLPRELQNLLYV